MLSAIFKMVLLVLFVVAGCSFGAPQLRTSASDGQGPLVTGCKNVSSSNDKGRLINDFYLSSGLSAFKEGAVAGLDEAQEVKDVPPMQDWIDENTWNSNSLERLKNLNLGFESNVYCRTYDATREQVFKVVETVVRGYFSDNVHWSNRAQGTLVTEWYDRGHGAAKWKDAYKITISSDSKTGIVRVFRDLYIQRLFPETDKAYRRATSVGHNEAWILGAIAEQLKRP